VLSPLKKVVTPGTPVALKAEVITGVVVELTTVVAIKEELTALTDKTLPPPPLPVELIVIVVPDGVVTELNITFAPATNIGLYVASIKSPSVICVIRSPLSNNSFN
jgi:hypothetical protein